MRDSDDLVSRRAGERGGRRIDSLLIAAAVSYLGLLCYLQIAAQPNLMLIEIWFAAPGAVLTIGTLIDRHPDRTHARHSCQARPAAGPTPREFNRKVTGDDHSFAQRPAAQW